MSEELFKSHQKEHEIDSLGTKFTYEMVEPDNNNDSDNNRRHHPHPHHHHRNNNENELNGHFVDHGQMRTFKSDGESCSSSVSSVILSPSTPNSTNDSPSIFVLPIETAHYASPSTNDDR